MTLETADLLAIAAIVLPLLLAAVGGTLAWLKSDIRDLRTETRVDMQALRTELRAEIRAVDAKVDALTQAILASALASERLATASKPDAASSET
ncbi:MAG: hypothetical protein F4Y02_05435 [Chloroflexi bacterium]|nr:hypothetical protein [Chloroflexota bacterium]